MGHFCWLRIPIIEILSKSLVPARYDLGGCDDPYKTDYMGLTCKQLEASKLHRLIRSVALLCAAMLCSLTLETLYCVSGAVWTRMQVLMLAERRRAT